MSRPEGRPAGPANEVLKRLRWPLTHRLGGQTAGDERSRYLGQGVEYADVREYQVGEDARRIDWSLTARSDRPYVRESNPDRGLDVWLIVDASRSLDWGTARSLKRDAADDLVNLLTLMLSRHGGRVGAIVFDSAPRRALPPRSGRRGRLVVLSRINAETSRPGARAATNLQAALQRANLLIRRPSLVIVVSDFLVDPGWEKPMKTLSLRHEVVAARISDPRESDIPAIGIVTFEDTESGRQLEVDTSSSRLRERYRAAAAARDRELRARLRSARTQLLDITTAEPVVTQLITFLRARQAQRGLRAGKLT